MKSYRKELWVETSQRRELINITHTVETCLRESGIVEGMVLVNAMHITASVFINDDEPGLHQDYKRWLETLAPFDASPDVYTVVDAAYGVPFDAGVEDAAVDDDDWPYD